MNTTGKILYFSPYAFSQLHARTQLLDSVAGTMAAEASPASATCVDRPLITSTHLS